MGTSKAEGIIFAILAFIAYFATYYAAYAEQNRPATEQHCKP